MHYSLSSPTGIIWMSPSPAAAVTPLSGARSRAESDRRWPVMLRKLRGLRKRGRRAIRIVDANCGAGELLMLAVRGARELGFVAIEARGVDSDPRLIASARHLAARQVDPAIGLVFEQGAMDEVMREEAEFPADLLLCSAREDEQRRLAGLARTAGATVLWDQAGSKQP